MKIKLYRSYFDIFFQGNVRLSGTGCATCSIILPKTTKSSHSLNGRCAIKFTVRTF